jgi:predicted ATPase/DNA-binding SARP family transcriptional activator/tRNA A-37 threonylcarbamoyl transferase component Bud32
MANLKLFLLGPPRIELDGHPLEIERRKAMALLIYLAVTGQPHARDALATLFWPDYDQRRARAYLRRDLAILNTGLTGNWLDADRETIELTARPDFWMDIAHFRQLLAQVQAHDHAREAVCAGCLELLAEAALLYKDDFLAGFTLRDSSEFDDWQFFQAESLRQELAQVLERLVYGYYSRGEYEQAIPFARRWLALDPLHGPAQRQLMQLYDQADQPTAALRQYEEYVALLEEELGIPPEEETTTLYEAIKAKRMLGPFVKTHRESSPAITPPNRTASEPEPAKSKRYAILEKIGQGGFATVYRACDNDLGREVALKELHSHLLADTNWLKRFRREAQVIARLDHPQIVTIYDVGQVQSGPFLVMRLVEGPSLATLLSNRERLPWSEAVEMIRAVAEGLDYAHSQGILHRDLKPANILLDPDRGPVLTDFGFAKLVGDNSLSQSGSVVGTPYYIAPEVWEGQTATPQTDIYALGCILYEMLTGQKLFTGETPPAVMTAHFRSPLFPGNWPQGTPPGVVDILLKALARDPAERYATAADMVAALTGLAPGQSTEPPQASAQAGQAIATPAGPGQPARHLPHLPTSFIGREEELAEIKRLLVEEPDCRLLTLIGPGGIGKTRLAIEAARATAFRDGAWFVPLAPLSSAAFLASAIADELDLSFHGSQDPKQQLGNYLRHKQLLLVLDNFEHLLLASQPGQAAPDNGEAAGLIAHLLQQAPHLKILVSSRERLNLSAEWLFPLHGLTIPEKNETIHIESYSAVQLFIQRARQAQPHLGWHPLERASIARICRLVGGMPLGIELAAAWVAVLPLIEIPNEIERNLDFLASSMRDLPERHRSMRAIFDQSWALLTETEQTVFRRVSIFRGGCTRVALEAICGDSAGLDDDLQLNENGDLQLVRREFTVLQALVGLVNKSFLRQTATGLTPQAQLEGRYEVHELMRQYGAAKLEETPEDERQTRDRHAEYYLTFLARQESRMKGDDQQRAHEKVAQELENIKVSWRWAAAQGRTDLLIAAFEALWLFHVERNLFREAVSIFSRTVATLENGSEGDRDSFEQTLLLGLAQAAWGGNLMRMGDYAEAATHIDQALALLRPLKAGRWIALVLNFRAATYQLLGSYDEACRCLSESIDLSRQAGDRWLTAYSLNDLGMVTHLCGDTAEAQSLSQQSLTIFADLDDRRGMAFVFDNLGFFAFQLGDYPGADWLYRESLNLRRVNRDLWGVAHILVALGMIAHAQEDHQAARSHLLDAVRTALDVRATPVLLNALVEFATLLADTDAADQAQEILRVCLHHPSLSKHARQKAEPLLADLSAVTTPQPVAILPENEADDDLNALVTKLLAES